MLAYTTFVQAGRNWDEFSGIRRRDPTNWPTFANGLNEFLGCELDKIVFACDHFGRIMPDKVTGPPEALQRLTLLASPHFTTIIKARQALQGVSYN